MANIAVANPGSLVVPLSAIIDQLQGKLSAADLNALLLAIVSKQKAGVAPGDLITADLMNMILNDIDDLNRRLVILEAAQPPEVKNVLIIEPSPATTLRIGDPLIIKGQGLLADSLVTIEDQPIGGAFGSPDDNTLTFHAIPPIDIKGGLPSGGKSVTLAVSNKLGGYSTTFVLKPILLDKPIGSMVIAVSSKPSEGTIFKAGGTYTYKFKITADTKPDLLFRVAVGIGAANWFAIPAQTELFIPAAKDSGTPTVAELAVTVNIWDQAQTGDEGNLYVQLTAIEDSSFIWRSTPDENITVDDPASQIRKLNLAMSETTAGNAAIRTNPDESLTALIGPASGGGGTGELNFTVTNINGAFEPGEYQVDLAKLSAFIGDSAPAQWQAEIPSAPDGKVNLSGSAQPLRVSVTGQQDAPNAKLQLELTSVKNPTTSGAAEFDIEIR